MSQRLGQPAECKVSLLNNNLKLRLCFESQTVLLVIQTLLVFKDRFAIKISFCWCIGWT